MFFYYVFKFSCNSHTYHKPTRHLISVSWFLIDIWRVYKLIMLNILMWFIQQNIFILQKYLNCIHIAHYLAQCWIRRTRTGPCSSGSGRWTWGFRGGRGSQQETSRLRSLKIAQDSIKMKQVWSIYSAIAHAYAQPTNTCYAPKLHLKQSHSLLEFVFVCLLPCSRARAVSQFVHPPSPQAAKVKKKSHDLHMLLYYRLGLIFSGRSAAVLQNLSLNTTPLFLTQK